MKDNHSWFPKASGSSVTLTVYFSIRLEGQSSWNTAIPSLVVVYPTGANGGVPTVAVKEAILQYALNNGLNALYQPRDGVTPAQALERALGNADVGLGTSATSLYLTVRFDGEAGSVYVS